MATDTQNQQTTPGGEAERPPVERVVMCADEITDLQNDIFDAINKKINSHNLQPEQGAEILLVMAKEALECLAWIPQSKQAAIADIESAIKWLHT